MTVLLQVWGLVTEQDRALLIAYCDAWQDYWESRLTLTDEGPVLTAESGYRYANPINGMLERSRKAMLEISKRFGFTPSDRTGIKAVSVPKPRSDVAAWMSLRGGLEGHTLAPERHAAAKPRTPVRQTADTPVCECGNSIDKPKRGPMPVFCSDKCRKRASRSDTVEGATPRSVRGNDDATAR